MQLFTRPALQVFLQIFLIVWFFWIKLSLNNLEILKKFKKINNFLDFRTIFGTLFFKMFGLEMALGNTLFQ